MRKNPGSYTPSIERMRGRSASPEAEKRYKLNPQGRVVRHFNLGDHDGGQTDRWNDFLNAFARANDGTGTVRMPGHIKVTYQDTAQIGRMFAHKYPYHTQNELRIVMHAASKDFNEYVRDRATANIAIRNKLDSRPPDHHIHWLDGLLDIDDTLRPVDNSRTRLAFHFKPNGKEVLRDEHQEIVRFWGYNGFSKTNLERGEPHLSVFNSFVEIGLVSLDGVPQTVEQPSSVSLLAPKMEVMDNVPKGTGNR